MSAIEWTDATWNPVRGCSRVSEGCRNCYAERMAARFSDRGELEDPGVWLHKPGPFYRFAEMTKAGPRWTGKVELRPERLDAPLRWKKPRRVFVNSMSDLFHEGLIYSDIAAVFAVMACSPQHTFQILTKRPARMLEFSRLMAEREHRAIMSVALSAQPVDFPRALQIPHGWPLPNVWLGVSVEDQATADERIPLLLQTPAAVRFVSYEPALGAVDFRWGGMSLPEYAPHRPLPKLDWMIVGGESGPGARPFDIAWARSVVRQCREAGVACFVKQVGSRPIDQVGLYEESPRLYLNSSKGGDPAEWPEDLRVREFPR